MLQNSIPTQTPPPIGFIRQKDLIPHIVPVSHSTLWRWVKNGSLPAPYKLGPNIVGWKRSEIDAWMAAR